MSHEIKQLDVIKSIKHCWHGLETLEKAITFDNSGLTWGVEKRDLSTMGNDGEQLLIDGYSAIVCDDNDHIISVQRNTYQTIQNSRIWEALEKSLEGIDHTIEVTGSLRNRARIFISISLNDNQEYMVNRDKFQNFITFVSSHDGSMAVEAYDTSTRVVCQNTLNWSRMEKGALNLRVRHTLNNEMYIAKMEETIENLLAKREEFYLTYKALTEKPMSLEMAEKVVAGIIGNGEEYSTRAQNVGQRIIELYQSGQGNHGSTYADLLNGITEYYTHECHDDNAKRFDANQFGTADKRKNETFFALSNDAYLDKIIAQGEKLLATV